MKKKNWNRRDLLKSMSLAALGTPMAASTSSPSSANKEIPIIQKDHGIGLEKPVTAIVIGAGSRGWGAYSSYGTKFPEELKIIGVAEPIPYRRERISKAFDIPEKNQFVTWEHVFEVPKFADALIITTPDNLHYGPAIAGLEAGYDLLLEKVIAQTWKECNQILKLAVKHEAIVAVCHVLRYNAYFRKIKEVVDNKEIGEVVSIQHLEPVERIHMSHSFVRGNWRNAAESNPMILSKSCHDTDILRWIIGKSCLGVSSFGSLSFFKKENAPKGSTARCTDGCAIERECPYSAIKLYKEKRDWLYHLSLEEVNDDTIMRELKNGPYGRCVYQCDNDVVDHQIANFQFEDGITVSFSMEALTSYGGRRTRIFGTQGDLMGDEKTLVITNAITGDVDIWDATAAQKFDAGHGGADHALVYDFVRAVSAQNPGLLTSTIQASMESHLMGFQAETSRLSKGKKKEIKL